MYAGRQGTAGFRNGPRELSLFSAPRGMCADTNGSLVVADSDNACVRRITANGKQLRTIVPATSAACQSTPAVPAHAKPAMEVVARQARSLSHSRAVHCCSTLAL